MATTKIPLLSGDKYKKELSVVETTANDYPSEIHGYRIIRELGKGSQGTTYLAERSDAGFAREAKSVVIKKIIMHRGWDDYDNFRSESESLRRLNLPGVPRLYEAIEALGENPPACYIVLEYIPGKSLSEWQNSGRIFTVSEIIDIFRQVFAILGRIHARTPPLIHRDLKISNIMLDDADNKVTLIDFGLAQKQQLETNTRIDGTFGYIAQEQLMGKALPASDIYAAGVSMLSMIFNTKPTDFPRIGYDIDVKTLFANRDEESCLKFNPRLRISEIFPSVENFQLYQLLDNLVSPHPTNRIDDTDIIISLLDRSESQIQAHLKHYADLPSYVEHANNLKKQQLIVLLLIVFSVVGNIIFFAIYYGVIFFLR